MTKLKKMSNNVTWSIEDSDFFKSKEDFNRIMMLLKNNSLKYKNPIDELVKVYQKETINFFRSLIAKDIVNFLISDCDLAYSYSDLYSEKDLISIDIQSIQTSEENFPIAYYRVNFSILENDIKVFIFEDGEYTEFVYDNQSFSVNQYI